jgi:hypothetical protein
MPNTCFIRLLAFFGAQSAGARRVRSKTTTHLSAYIIPAEPPWPSILQLSGIIVCDPALGESDIFTAQVRQAPEFFVPTFA